MSAQVADCRLLNFYLILVSAWFWNIVPVLMTEVYIPHNPFLQSKIANKIIENFFDDCYVVKAGREATTAFTGAVMKSPTVNINYEMQDYIKAVHHFAAPASSRHGFLTKYNRQCIVYYIALAGFKTMDVDELLSLFTFKALQVESFYSYLIITEFDSNEQLRSFIMSPVLKNFRYRMFVQPSGEAKNSEFTLVPYCYFCFNGNPEITRNSKAYRSVEEIQNLDKVFPDMTRNFNGKTMRVVAPYAPPLVAIVPSKTEPGKKDIQGQHANILKSISHHYNFTYSLYVSPLTGTKLPNGTWNGIMGEVLYDRADIGLSVATSYDRYQIIDVTTAVFYAFLVLVSTKPTPTFEWQAVFYPFKPNCWLAFIASIIMTFFVSKWIHNTSIKYEIPWTMKGRSRLDIFNTLQANFLTNYKSFYITVGNLLEQGPPFDFNSIPSRMFVTFWMFFAMIITTAYRSKLFSFLTFPTVLVPPSTFLELVGSNYKWGMKHLGGIAFVFITKSPLAYVRNIGERMQVYNDKYGCLDRTFRGRFTCITYGAYIDYLMEIRYWKLRHSFHVSDFVSPPVGSSWVLPKHAPWLQAFDKASFPIYEMGLANKYMTDYQVDIAKVIRAKAQGSNSTQDMFDLNTNFKGDDEGPRPLVMANLYAAFFILLFGVAFGAILLGLEIARTNEFNNALMDKQRRLRIHLGRKLRLKKKELELPRGQRLSFRQVVKVIGPNTHDILETEQRQMRSVVNTVARARAVKKLQPF